jgi:hypothetical protein
MKQNRLAIQRGSDTRQFQVRADLALDFDQESRLASLFDKLS